MRKCPYCDFNSHRLEGHHDLDGYVHALLLDLEAQREWLLDRPLESIFIGGGTPSLLTGKQVAGLLDGIKQRIPLSKTVEITLEANPGTTEARHFSRYRDCGINRLSLGFQSLDDNALQAIGRIHDRHDALTAFDLARSAGFNNINIDLMFALPGHDPCSALSDLQQALMLTPEHLSWYQLAIEPNTPFAHRPPALPNEETICQIQEQGDSLLQEHGYQQYEVSAYCQPDRQCQHNLNYWRFGDYLGLGAGAHGKITLRTGKVLRYRKARHPAHYLRAPQALAEQRVIAPHELPLEFMMNALRLKAGIELALFEQRTRLPISTLTQPISKAKELGLLTLMNQRLQPTPLGYRFLNDLILLFDEG